MSLDKIKDIIIIVLLVMLAYILNTTYTIQIDNITYSQKIYDYIVGRE